MGDEKFNKLEFLNAFNDFRAKAFKSTIIRSTWRQTGLVLYNPVLVLDKVREAHLPAPLRPITPPPTESYEFEPLQRTPHTIRELTRAATTILMTPNVPQSLLQPLSSLVKDAVTRARRGELMEARFDQRIRAKEARKQRKSATNQIFQTDGVLSSKYTRAMTKERADLEAQRELDREIA